MLRYSPPHTSLLNLAFQLGIGRLFCMISEENFLRVPWQLPCSPITYPFTIKFWRKVAAIEAKNGTDWMRLLQCLEAVTLFPWQDTINSNTMLHNWKEGAIQSKTPMACFLLVTQVHPHSQEYGLQESLPAIFLSSAPSPHSLGPPPPFTSFGGFHSLTLRLPSYFRVVEILCCTIYFSSSLVASESLTLFSLASC